MNKLAVLLLLLSATFAKAQVEQGFSQSALIVKRLELKSEDDGTSLTLFNDDVVQIVDYSEKPGSRIFECYHNGKKYFTEQTNLYMADSTFNHVKELNKEQREIARNQARQFSKMCYDAEFAKALKYYKQDQEETPIFVNSLNQNSFDKSNLDFDFEFFNISPKTVVKIQLTLVGYGDEQMESIVQAKTETFKGNVKTGEFGHYLFRNVWKSKKLTYKDISSLKIEFSDGSSEVFEEIPYFSQTYLYYATGKAFQVDNIIAR